MRLRESARVRTSRSSAEILSGRYRLDGPLGSGGAADVHRGFDLRLGRPVAVKVFRTGTGFDSEATLHGEAKILARLDHPNLVSAYDAGQHDGRAFLVMQLVEGTTLRNLIARGPLSPAATAAIGAGLARALAHAHDGGIVHRDVKPSNILLDGARRPYLTDFGISRLLDATTRTLTGTLVGTAAYLSPEQVLGRPVGRPADVYALGLVLLECITGRLEYDGGPLEAAIARLHRQPVVPSSLPEDLAALLRDMTAPDEQSRPTAHACARILAASAAAAGPETLAREAAPVPVAPREPQGPQVAQGPPRTTAGRTHLRHSSPADRAASHDVPARGRTLVVGATAALAVVMATAFAVTDDSAPRGDERNATRATGSPSVRTDSAERDGAGDEAAAVPPTASPSDRGASVGTLSDTAGRSARPDPRSTDPATAGGATRTAPPVPSGTDALTAVARDDAATKDPNRPPGRLKKAEKGAKKAAEKAEKAQRKKPGKPGKPAEQD
ncbi:protein kinase domain-containing protein [Streptomyces sp. MMBL 11-3]|uniref:serine/threonine-protein kinase n=1 Tax=Streptomyces sp. MMBL 11-3 TaxID=3382639 RepID=UPI0039B366D0